MIERISSPVPARPAAGPAPAPAPARATATGAALVDALTRGGPVGTPLRGLAGEAAAALAAAAGRADPVGIAQIERAVLDFAREAKAFAIGHGDRGGDAVRATLDEALAQGAAQADRLPAGDAGDRAIALFAHAAAHLQTD